jgi:hypothetical protein
MKEVPANKRFVLWAYAPDGQYTKLGQIVTTGRKDSGTIESNTALTDFGLLMTVEDAEVNCTNESRLYGDSGGLISVFCIRR